METPFDVEVYSHTAGRWLRGKAVHLGSTGEVLVHYDFDGSQMRKQLPLHSKHCRQAQSEDISITLDNVTGPSADFLKEKGLETYAAQVVATTATKTMDNLKLSSDEMADEAAEPAAPAAPGLSDAANVYSSKEALCEALNAGHTVFVDGQWFVDQHKAGGRLLRRQEMEEKFDSFLVKNLQPDDIWDMRPDIGCILTDVVGRWLLVAISYPWLEKDHPDPEGSQLAELAHYMGKFITEPQLHGIRVAAFLDFASLYQGKRTESQSELFQRGLQSVNLWYGHRSVQVWALTHTADTRPYHDRGWTTFEWSIGHLANCFVFDWGKAHKLYEKHPEWRDDGNVFDAIDDARVKADPPKTPAEFNVAVQGKLFTNRTTDLPFVQQKYEETMTAILAAVTDLNYCNATWTEAQFVHLAEGILPLCGKLRSLNLGGCSGMTDVPLGKVAENCPNLQGLKLTKCCEVTDIGVSKVAEHCLNLQDLTLDYCQRVTDTGVSKVAEHCPKLRTLNLAFCGFTDVGVIKVAEHCPRLEHLNLRSCLDLTDTGLSKVAEHCPDLQVLILNYCTQITDIGMSEVAQHCPKLQVLGLESCWRLTDIGVIKVAEHGHNLRDLTLCNCWQVTDVGLCQVAEHCPNLQTLDLQSGEVTDIGVSKVAEHCPNLQVLNLSRCEKLTDVGVIKVAEHCPSLENLDLRRCKEVTDVGVIKVAEYCCKLEFLDLSLGPKVTNLGLSKVVEHCRNLRKLDLSSCAVSYAAIKRLQKELPACEVRYDWTVHEKEEGRENEDENKE